MPDEPLAFGLSQEHPSGDLEEKGARFSRALAAALRQLICVAIYPTYRAQLEALLSGALALAWLPPLMQQEAMDAGAVLIALPQRSGFLTYRSVVLMRGDAPWASFADVRGARAAWRNPNSASGYLFPRLELLSRGVSQKAAFSDERFYGCGQRAAEAVASGEADLCTSFINEAVAGDREAALHDARRVLGRAADGLRLLHITEEIPPDGIVVGRHVAAGMRMQLAEALHAMHGNPEGLAAIGQLLHAERLVPVSEAILRSLGTWAAIAGVRAA